MKYLSAVIEEERDDGTKFLVAWYCDYDGGNDQDVEFELDEKIPETYDW